MWMDCERFFLMIVVNPLKGWAVSCVYEVWEWRAEVVNTSKLMRTFTRTLQMVANITPIVPLGRPKSDSGVPCRGSGWTIISGEFLRSPNRRDHCDHQVANLYIQIFNSR